MDYISSQIIKMVINVGQRVVIMKNLLAFANNKVDQLQASIAPMRIKWLGGCWKNSVNSTQRNAVRTFHGFILGCEKKNLSMEQVIIIGRMDQQQISRTGKKYDNNFRQIITSN